MIQDVWEKVGSNKDVEFTWDETVNTNLQSRGANTRRERFDRVLMKNNRDKTVEAEDFTLIGLKKISSGLYPSDHWGIKVNISLH